MERPSKWKRKRGRKKKTQLSRACDSCNFFLLLPLDSVQSGIFFTFFLFLPHFEHISCWDEFWKKMQKKSSKKRMGSFFASSRRKPKEKKLYHSQVSVKKLTRGKEVRILEEIVQEYFLFGRKQNTLVLFYSSTYLNCEQKTATRICIKSCFPAATHKHIWTPFLLCSPTIFNSFYLC